MGREATISGVKVSGSWEAIADEAEAIADELDANDVDGVEDFKDWKPETDDDLADVEDRTVEHARVDVPDDRPILSRLLDTFQWFETVLYKHVMLRTAPQYFDADAISAKLEKNTMEVTTSDDEARDDIQP